VDQPNREKLRGGKKKKRGQTEETFSSQGPREEGTQRTLSRNSTHVVYRKSNYNRRGFVRSKKVDPNKNAPKTAQFEEGVPSSGV